MRRRPDRNSPDLHVRGPTRVREAFALHGNRHLFRKGLDETSEGHDGLVDFELPSQRNEGLLSARSLDCSPDRVRECTKLVEVILAQNGLPLGLFGAARVGRGDRVGPDTNPRHRTADGAEPILRRAVARGLPE